MIVWQKFYLITNNDYESGTLPNAKIIHGSTTTRQLPKIGFQISKFSTAKDASDFLENLYMHDNYAKEYQLHGQTEAIYQGESSIQDFYIKLSMQCLWSLLNCKQIQPLSNIKKKTFDTIVDGVKKGF